MQPIQETSDLDHEGLKTGPKWPPKVQRHHRAQSDQAAGRKGVKPDKNSAKDGREEKEWEADTASLTTVDLGLQGQHQVEAAWPKDSSWREGPEQCPSTDRQDYNQTGEPRRWNWRAELSKFLMNHMRLTVQGCRESPSVVSHAPQEHRVRRKNLSVM